MTIKIEKLKKKIKKQEEKDIKYLKDNNEDVLSRCKYEFDKYQNSDSYFYDSVVELYDYIKKTYIKRLKEGNLDIKLERIRIEECLGSHKKVSEKLDSSSIVIVTSIITILINLIITCFEELAKAKEIFWDKVLLIGIIISVIVMQQAYKSNKDSGAYERDLVNYISLKVLDDIEKGIKK